MRESVRVLLLCGGQGTRLASVLGGVPKALAPIHGRPFLDYLLATLLQAGFVDIVLCTGVGHDQIAAHVRSCWGTNIHLSREPRPLGTAGALRYARGWVQDTVLVVNGDTVVTVDYHAMLTWHRLWRSVATVAAQVCDPAQASGTHLRIAHEHAVPGQGQITYVRVSNSADEYDRVVVAPAGAYVLDPCVLDIIPNDVPSSLDQDILPLLVNRDAPCWAFVDGVEFFDIGTPERYAQAQERMKGLEYAVQTHSRYAL